MHEATIGALQSERRPSRHPVDGLSTEGTEHDALDSNGIFHGASRSLGDFAAEHRYQVGNRDLARLLAIRSYGPVPISSIGSCALGNPHRSSMSSLPPAVWIAAIVALAVLLGLCGATAYAVLRASARSRIASWPGSWVVALLAAAIVPWLIIRLTPTRLSVSIHGVAAAIGWLLVALLVFALLVLLPLAAVLIGLVWWRRRSG